jgi:hypothetical protein
VEGVGFLEAKRIFAEGEYESVDWGQLFRISQRTKYPLLLLYDNCQVSEFADNLLFQPFVRGMPIRSLDVPFSHAVVVQSPLALKLQVKNRSLHKFALPLSYQICARFLRTQDLDFDPSAVDQVKRYVGDTFGGPRYLLVASVSSGGVELPSIGQAEISSDTWELLGQRATDE